MKKIYLIKAFNGLGKFILSKAIDSSFELQGFSEIMDSGNPSFQGTIFSSFAMRLNNSQIFEFRLSNMTTQSNNSYISKKNYVISYLYHKLDSQAN